MTRQKSFKRLVRARMEKTGESYTAARASLLAAEEHRATEAPTLTMSDDAIRRRTGRGWEEWFDLLDQWDAAERTHKEIARWLREEQGVDGWGAQSVTVSYERSRGLRAVGERPEGFSITASKTLPCPSSGYTTRSSMSCCAHAGCGTASFASAPPRSRGRPASTGVTAGRGSSSASTQRAMQRAPWPSSMRDSPTPRRRSG